VQFNPAECGSAVVAIFENCHLRSLGVARNGTYRAAVELASDHIATRAEQATMEQSFSMYQEIDGSSVCFA
jgi:hypothetical protein